MPLACQKPLRWIVERRRRERNITLSARSPWPSNEPENETSVRTRAVIDISMGSHQSVLEV